MTNTVEEVVPLTEREELLRDLRIVERGPAIPGSIQAVATRAIAALTRTQDPAIEGLVDALEPCPLCNGTQTVPDNIDPFSYPETARVLSVQTVNGHTARCFAAPPPSPSIAIGKARMGNQ